MGTGCGSTCWASQGVGRWPGLPFLPFLPFLRTPTRVRTGSAGPIVPAVHARPMARPIPRSTQCMPDDGHLFLFSQARECAARMDAFLDADPHAPWQ